jgi:type III secretory pathway component EscR
MNFLLKIIVISAVVFVGTAYVASQQDKNTVGEVTLDDLGKTASEGANKIRHYLANDAKKDSKEVFSKTKQKIEEVTE